MESQSPRVAVFVKPHDEKAYEGKHIQLLCVSTSFWNYNNQVDGPPLNWKSEADIKWLWYGEWW